MRGRPVFIKILSACPSAAGALAISPGLNIILKSEALMKFLLPKEPAFSENFLKMSATLTEITAVFQEFAVDFRDFESYWRKAKDIEHKADGVAHVIISLINKSFITPFDREDIYQLIHEFDDIIDLIENTLHSFYLYEVTAKKPFVDGFAELIGRATPVLNELIAEVFKQQKYTESMWKHIRELHDLEDEGDVIYQQSLRTLFQEERDPIAVIKWKDILGTLEHIMDVFQNMSNTVEGIVVKGS
jgi:predicted phosphate transport protein (TIGR00153 family)